MTTIRSNPNPMALALRENFFREFSVFTQHTYLLAFAAARLPQADFRVIAADLRVAIKELLDENDPKWNEAITGDSDKLREAAPMLPRFVIEILVVRLDALLHNVLDILNRNQASNSDNQSVPFENDLQEVKRLSLWAYQGVVLMAEFRNAIVHNGGKLSRSRFQRLQDAGWSEADISAQAEKLNNDLSLSDFLKLKAKVRIAADIAFEEHGAFRHKLSDE